MRSRPIHLASAGRDSVPVEVLEHLEGTALVVGTFAVGCRRYVQL